MAARGNEILQNYAERILNERNFQTVTQRCGHCPWTVTDQLGVTRPAFAAHILEHHPEVTLPKPKLRKRRANAPRTIGRSVEENIVLARSQGAAGWFSDQ